MGDDWLPRAVALFVLAIFGVAAVISFIDPRRPIPPELYPLATVAAGYLLGYRVMKGNGK